MSLAAISCLETDFVDEIEELKGESSVPPSSYGDDSMSTLDFNCSQTSMFASASFLDSVPSFPDSVTSSDHIAESDESSKKRPVYQFTATRSCLKSQKAVPTAKTRVRLPTIPSDRPPLTPQGSLRRITLVYSPIRSPDPSPLGGKKMGVVLRSPARSPHGSTRVLRRDVFRARPRSPFSPSKSPRIQGIPRYSPASRPRKRVTFDLLDEATVGSLAEEESMGFSDLGDDHFESGDECGASFRCADQYFKSDKKEFSFVSLQLSDSCLHLNLNSDTDSESEVNDDDETLESSDRLLGKENELCLAVQDIEQIIEDQPQCLEDPPPMGVSSWNDNEESLTLDWNENNGSSESISPTSIASFPESLGWGEGKETLTVPKFLSESLKARASPQTILASKELKALLKSAMTV